MSSQTSTLHASQHYTTGHIQRMEQAIMQLQFML